MTREEVLTCSFSRILSEAMISQADFCRVLEIPRRSLQRWIHGDGDCPPYIRLLIAYRLGVLTKSDWAKGRMEDSEQPLEFFD